jgi:hypothetical protein
LAEEFRSYSGVESKLLTSEAEDLITSWAIENSYVFDYRGYWLDPEILVINRKAEDLFVVDYSRSTVKEGPFTKEQMLKMLTKNLIVHRLWASVNTNYREERTGGCTCGAWRISKDYPHAFSCKRYAWK